MIEGKGRRVRLIHARGTLCIAIDCVYATLPSAAGFSTIYCTRPRMIETRRVSEVPKSFSRLRFGFRCPKGKM
jgi:hypothetical protein